MSFDDETEKLIKLRKITKELQSNRDTLHNVWVNMQKFAQGLRNELDDNYWSEHKIAFIDLSSVPQHNQFRFNFSELEQLFNIGYVKEILDNFRNLTEEKKKLESELGISMDSQTTRVVNT
jgi:hypothetical protein